MKTEVLSLNGVCRYFDNKPVLEDLALRIYFGELVLLVGRSGSGKSVLAKIITGQMPPDQGQMRLARQAYAPESIGEAFTVGVAYISKDGRVMENLTIAENICLSGARDYNGLGFAQKLQAIAAAFCSEHGEILPVAQTMERLTRLERIKVQILRAKYCQCRLIVLDGVLPALTEGECRELLAFLRKLLDPYLAVVLLDYGNEALLPAADRVLLLQNGRIAADCDTAIYPPERLYEAMRAFRQVEQSLGYFDAERIGPQSEAEKLFLAEGLQISCREGETIGLWAASTVDFLWMQELFLVRRTRDSMREERERILLLTENNLQNDYFLDLSVSENLILPSLRRIAVARMFLNSRRKSFAVQEYGKLLSIDRLDMGKPLRHFGQRQREEAVLFRSLASRSRYVVLSGIVDELNHARYGMVSRFIKDAVAHRKTVLIVSQNLDILEALCDRVENHLKTGEAAGMRSCV